MTAPIYVVYGPQGSGKSTHALRIMLALNCTRLVDDWKRREGLASLQPGDLAMTSDDLSRKHLPGVRVMHIQDVVDLLDCSAKRGLL
jgi:hypothetical protein